MYNSVSKNVTVKVEDTSTLDFILDTGFSIDQPVSIGSRAQPKSSLRTTAPVDIIAPQELTNSTQIELSHILHYLVPSFHSTNQTVSDGTDHIDPATLRGLGPDQVLVLINGTVGRGTVGTDFYAIPVTSIERIEILRDGATSQYGSDAIAGVVNIILKKQVEVIDLVGRVGINKEGDGQTYYFGANFGFNVGQDGFLNITGEYRSRETKNRTGNYTGLVYSDSQTEDNLLINQNDFLNSTGYDDQQIMEI